jgi:hypothetical protein
LRARSAGKGHLSPRKLSIFSATSLVFRLRLSDRQNPFRGT